MKRFCRISNGHGERFERATFYVYGIMAVRLEGNEYQEPKHERLHQEPKIAPSKATFPSEIWSPHLHEAGISAP